MRVFVTGATGYIGGRLVPLLREQRHEVVCFARAAERLRGRFDDDVEIVDGDIADGRAVEKALAGCDAAYYLIHSMAATSEFAQADRDAAQTFAQAAKVAGLKRIVYLGGLGDGNRDLSKHLRSRHEVGEVLGASGVPTVEFRAAVIIGSGSISFEMMRYLTERLPLMIAPVWVVTRCQPIGIRDVLAYLVRALDVSLDGNRIYEIGGADRLTYRDMMLRYAQIRGLRRTLIVVPFFTPKLSSYWVHLVTPVSARLAQPLILGLHNEVVVRDDAARRDFPSVVPAGFDEAVRLALDRYRTAGVHTTWFDAFGRRVLPQDFSGVTEGMLVDMRVRASRASPERIAAVFSSLGGARGWLVANGLWRLRGWLDRFAGGVGLRRGRRSPRELRVGDAVDFWRVEAYERDKFLRLRAEMKLPGRAWLQFEAEPDGTGSRLRQTAFFEPHGLLGTLYWYAVAVFHEWVFAQMANRIVREAEA